MSKARQRNQKRMDYLRQKQRCELCGAETKLELHHIIPLSCGGRDKAGNWMAVCHSCHSKLTPTSELTRAGFRRMRIKNALYDLDDFYRILDSLEGHYDWQDIFDVFEEVRKRVSIDLYMALGLTKEEARDRA